MKSQQSVAISGRPCERYALLLSLLCILYIAD